jgi:hypothetical protein
MKVIHHDIALEEIGHNKAMKWRLSVPGSGRRPARGQLWQGDPRLRADRAIERGARRRPAVPPEGHAVAPDDRLDEAPPRIYCHSTFRGGDVLAGLALHLVFTKRSGLASTFAARPCRIFSVNTTLDGTA